VRAFISPVSCSRWFASFHYSTAPPTPKRYGDRYEYRFLDRTGPNLQDSRSYN
jgi:hypothetical protein